MCGGTTSPGWLLTRCKSRASPGAAAGRPRPRRVVMPGTVGAAVGLAPRTPPRAVTPRTRTRRPAGRPVTTRRRTVGRADGKDGNVGLDIGVLLPFRMNAHGQSVLDDFQRAA